MVYVACVENELWLDLILAKMEILCIGGIILKVE